VTWNDHDTCRDTACISGARAGLVSFGEALPLVCSLLRRATTAAATWKRLEARLRQERAYLSQPPLFDLTTSARCEVLCSGADGMLIGVLIVAEKPRA
jgi:hypothetical protein